MKTIGIIGGMSWESSSEYYRLLNRHAKARLGGHHNASSLLLTVDFATVEAHQRAGDWDALGAQMAGAARQLELGGADLVILATNTMHKVYESIGQAITIPFLHIADPTGSGPRASSESACSARATPWSRPFTRDGCRSATRSTR
jgi:aspartate racemase